jgi:hypothetical protein
MLSRMISCRIIQDRTLLFFYTSSFIIIGQINKMNSYEIVSFAADSTIVSPSFHCLWWWARERVRYLLFIVERWVNRFPLTLIRRWSLPSWWIVLAQRDASSQSLAIGAERADSVWEGELRSRDRKSLLGRPFQMSVEKPKLTRLQCSSSHRLYCQYRLLSWGFWSSANANDPFFGSTLHEWFSSVSLLPCQLLHLTPLSITLLWHQLRFPRRFSAISRGFNVGWPLLWMSLCKRKDRRYETIHLTVWCSRV